jgi:hypothetical protein
MSGINEHVRVHMPSLESPGVGVSVVGCFKGINTSVNPSFVLLEQLSDAIPNRAIGPLRDPPDVGNGQRQKHGMLQAIKHAPDTLTVLFRPMGVAKEAKPMIAPDGNR